MNNLPRIDPMKLSLIPEPFDHPDWLFELKHDGFRALTYIAEDQCDLVSRQRRPPRSATAAVPSLIASTSSPQLGVFGLVHHAHAAATQLLDDAVVQDGLANHRKGTASGRSS